MTVSDNTGRNDGKQLTTWRWDLAARGNVRTHRTEIAHGSALPSLGANDLQAAIEPGNAHRVFALVENVSAVTLTDKQLGTDWSTLQRFADEWTITKTRQSAATLTAGAFLVGDSRVEQDFPASWARDSISVSAWVPRARTEYDNVLGENVTITESVIAPATSTPSATGLLTYERRAIDTWHDLLVETKVGDGSTAWTRTHYTMEPYRFPGVLTSIVLGNGFDQHQLRSVFTVQAVVRQSFTLDVVHKHIDTLVSASEAAVLVASTPSGDGTTTQLAACVQPVTQDLVYNGYLFSVSIGDVLNDAFSGGSALVATTNSADTYYGSVSETCSFAATTITATAYAALMSGGLYQPIRDTLVPWRAGYYLRRRTFIKMK